MQRRDVVLGLAMVGGPIAWFVDLVASWMAEPRPGSTTGSMAALHGITLGTLIVALTALAVGVVELHALGRRRDESDRAGTRHARRRFMAIGAIVLSVAAVLLIVATAVPKWILAPGDQP